MSTNTFYRTASNLAGTALTQVPHHSVLVVRSAVILAEWVEDAPRAHQTLGKVPKNVHADSVSALWREQDTFPGANFPARDTRARLV